MAMLWIILSSCKLLLDSLLYGILVVWLLHISGAVDFLNILTHLLPNDVGERITNVLNNLSLQNTGYGANNRIVFSQNASNQATETNEISTQTEEIRAEIDKRADIPVQSRESVSNDVELVISNEKDIPKGSIQARQLSESLTSQDSCDSLDSPNDITALEDTTESFKEHASGVSTISALAISEEFEDELHSIGNDNAAGKLEDDLKEQHNQEILLHQLAGRALDLTSNDESDLTKSVEAVLNSDAFIKSIDQLTDDKIHRITETVLQDEYLNATMLETISGIICTVVEKRANNIECDIKALVVDHSEGMKKELTDLTCKLVEMERCIEEKQREFTAERQTAHEDMLQVMKCRNDKQSQHIRDLRKQIDSIQSDTETIEGRERIRGIVKNMQNDDTDLLKNEVALLRSKNACHVQMLGEHSLKLRGHENWLKGTKACHNSLLEEVRGNRNALDAQKADWMKMKSKIRDMNDEIRDIQFASHDGITRFRALEEKVSELTLHMDKRSEGDNNSMSGAMDTASISETSHTFETSLDSTDLSTSTAENETVYSKDFRNRVANLPEKSKDSVKKIYRDTKSSIMQMEDDDAKKKELKCLTKEHKNMQKGLGPCKQQ